MNGSRERVGTARYDERWIALWSLLLALLLLGPALGNGFVLTYDMVWVPDLALNSDVLGLSSGLPRAVPSDALIAVVDEVVPGLVLQKLLLLIALTGAGIGAARLVPGPLAARLAVAGIYQWNAFVVERLLIGHWPVLIGYAALPWVLLLARRWREEGRLPAALLVLLPLASLSASAGLVTALATLCAAWGRGRRRMVLVLLAAANAPWLVAGLTHASNATTDPAGARVFALHDEGPIPGPLAALTLGGIWNSEVVPDSRAGVLGWLTLVALGALCVAGFRRWRRDLPHRDRVTLVVCWAVGWGTASATWVAPGAVGWLGETVPGLGVLRDGGRVLVLCAPLLVVLVGYGVAEVLERIATSKASTVSALLVAGLLPVALLPDAAWGADGQLRPATYPDSWQSTRSALGAADIEGDLLVLPLSSFRRPGWNHDRTVFDPLGRYLGKEYVASDTFSVAGRVIAGEDPRAAGAAEALAAATPRERTDRLVALGIGAVVVDRTALGGETVPDVTGEPLDDAVTGRQETELTVMVLDGQPDEGAAELPSRLALAMAWLAYLGLLLSGVVVKCLRRGKP